MERQFEILFFLRLLLYLLAPQHAGSYFLDQRLNPHPPQWKHGVLTIGLPGKSPVCNVIYFFKKCYLFGGTILVATGRIFGRGIWDLVP